MIHSQGKKNFISGEKYKGQGKSISIHSGPAYPLLVIALLFLYFLFFRLSGLLVFVNVLFGRTVEICKNQKT